MALLRVFLPTAGPTLHNSGAKRHVLAPICLHVEQLGGAEACFRPRLHFTQRNFGALRLVSAPEIIISRTSRNNNDLPCYETPFRRHGDINSCLPYHETSLCWRGERYLAKVARTESAMLRQAFGRIGGKGPAGPTRAAVLRSSRTASVRRRWTGHSALTKRRSSPSSNRGGQARPFPTSARRPVGAGHTVRDNKPEQISLLFQVNF